MRLAEWNPIRGCSAISPGCANCAGLAGAASDLTDGRAWSGATRLDEQEFAALEGLIGPRAVFVCTHGDLFHEATPEAWIDRVFAAMEARPDLAFQILTKRADRMRDYSAARYRDVPAPAHLAFGISAERQRELDARGAALAEVPARVRYVTLYPLLEAVDLARVLPFVALVGAGGEPKRPADPAWFASAAEQCAAAGVAFARAGLVGSA